MSDTHRNLRFSLGHDTEFIIQGPQDVFIPAYTVLNDPTGAGNVGLDGTTDIAELRCPPADNVPALMQRIEAVMRKDMPFNVKANKTLGGAYPSGNPIGTHIHFGVPAHGGIIQVLQHVVGVFCAFVEPDPDGKLRRKFGHYGGLTDTRNKDYGFEYRSPFSFLADKELASYIFTMAGMIGTHYGEIYRQFERDGVLANKRPKDGSPFIPPPVTDEDGEPIDFGDQPFGHHHNGGIDVSNRDALGKRFLHAIESINKLVKNKVIDAVDDEVMSMELMSEYIKDNWVYNPATDLLTNWCPRAEDVQWIVTKKDQMRFESNMPGSGAFVRKLISGSGTLRPVILKPVVSDKFPIILEGFNEQQLKAVKKEFGLDGEKTERNVDFWNEVKDLRGADAYEFLKSRDELRKRSMSSRDEIRLGVIDNICRCENARPTIHMNVMNRTVQRDPLKILNSISTAIKEA